MSRPAKKSAPNGANFLGLSFQAGILIFLGAFGGLKLDKFLGTSPLFLLLFVLLATVLAMYYIIRKATHKK
jgi:F0F1-type ATP synthase assembly protein I